MKLYYSFDSRLKWFDDDNYILDLYKFTMSSAKKLNNEIIFYGDTKSINYLDGYYDSSVCIDDVDIRFLDDVKMYIHSKEGLDCITVDGDLLIHKNFETLNGDAWFELNWKMTDELQEYYKKQLSIFKNIIPQIKYFESNETEYVNVGLIKFNNQSIKDYFLESYYNIRNLYIKDGVSFKPKYRQEFFPSIVFTQYYFNCIIKNNSWFDIKYFKDHYDSYYTHYVGDFKFGNEIKEIVKSHIENKLI